MHDVSINAAKKDPNDVLPVDKEKIRNDGQQGMLLHQTRTCAFHLQLTSLAIRHLRTILSLVLTNSEVRKLLSDLAVIGCDLLARGASKAADKIRPDEEALAHVDESALQDQFITKGGRVAGPNETPVLEARVPGTNTRVAQHPKDDLGHEAKVTHSDGTTKSSAQAMQEGVDVANHAVDQGSSKARMHCLRRRG
jgi:hypothetical protein